MRRRIADAGRKHGLRHAGSLAAAALAIGQGQRRFGSEANPQISAVAAGIDASLDLDANRAFIGRAAVARERRRPPARQIRAFTLACRADQTLTHAPVLRQGRPAGYVTNAAHRASQGEAVLLALVERAGEGDFSAVVGGETLLLRPARD